MVANLIYLHEALNNRIALRKAQDLLNNPPYKSRVNVAYAKNTLVHSLIGAIVAGAYRILRNNMDYEDIDKGLLKSMATGAVVGAGIGTVRSINQYNNLQKDISNRVANRYDELYQKNKRDIPVVRRLFSRSARKKAAVKSLRDLNDELISYKENG